MTKTIDKPSSTIQPRLKREAEIQVEAYDQPYALLSNSDGLFRVPLSRIVYCASHNSCTVFHLCCSKRIVVTNTPLTVYETGLTKYGFTRTNQSCVLNLSYLDYLMKGDKSGMLKLLTGEEIPLSRLSKASFLEKLRSRDVFHKAGINKPLNGHKPTDSPKEDTDSVKTQPKKGK